MDTTHLPNSNQEILRPAFTGRTYDDDGGLTSQYGFNSYSLGGCKDSPQNFISSKVTPNPVDIDPWKSYQMRLDTFVNWPSSANVEPHLIARAGMSYTGQDDRVICDFCRGILYSWEEGDDPLDEHHTHFGNCSFLQGKSWQTLDRILLSQKQKKSSLKDMRTSGKLETIVPIVKTMGYDDKIIDKALSLVSVEDLSTNTLLDAIFELESKENDTEDSEDIAPPSSTISKEKHLRENSIVPQFASCHIKGTATEVCKAASGSIKDPNHSKVHTSQVEEPMVKSKNFAKTVVEKEMAVEETKEKSHHHKNMDLNNNTTKKELSAEECERISKLTEERDKLLRSVYCNVCYKNKIGMLFLPCRHYCACDACGASLKDCLVCKKEIVATVKIFI